MTDTTHRAFLGDGERAFRLTPEIIVELERKTGIGIGGLCRRVFAGSFNHADLTETIRLALIGGGTAPAEAQALVTTYVAARPVAEAMILAVAILERLWFGDTKSNEAPDAAV